jgi:hypothetical protein
MKHFPVFIAFLSFSICLGQDTNRAWVKVMTDYGMGARIDTIRFVISDGYTPRTVYSVADENGTFLAGFDISNSMDILWSFKKGKMLPLIITPDDTIRITIISESDGYLFGKRARTCSNLMEMYDVPNRPRVQAYESEYTRDPRDFVDLMNDRLNAHLKFVNTFCKSSKCTKTFVTWYLKSSYVSYYRNLADYGHSFQRKIRDAVQLNEFLRAREVIVKSIDLNDPTLEMSSGYYDLLKSIFSLYVTPEDLRSLYFTKASSVLLELEKGIGDGDRKALRRIQSGGFATSDLTVLSHLSQKYKRQINTAVWNSVDPSIQQKLGDIKDPDMRKVIFSYYKGIRNWI